MDNKERRRIELEELAGGLLKRPRGRPRKNPDDKSPKPASKKAAKALPSTEPSDDEDLDLSYRGIHRMRAEGIPIRGLALLFGVSEYLVKTRLRDVKPSGFGGHGNPLYIVSEAAPYIVDSKVNLKEFLSSLRDEDLPDDMRLKFWSARRQRNKTLIEEGELWYRAEVVAKFGEVLLAIREKLQLIPEQIERMSGVTPEQYKMFRTLVDSVQEEMHKTIVELAENDQTLSVLGHNQEDEVVL